MTVAGSSGGLTLTADEPLAAAAQGQRWYHLVAVKEGTSRLTLYVDGQVVATRSQGVPAQLDTLRVLSLGAPFVRTASERHFIGALGSVALWDEALGQAEVESLWTVGDRRRSPTESD